MFFSLVVVSLFLVSGRADSDLDPNTEGEDEMELPEGEDEMELAEGEDEMELAVVSLSSK